MPYCTPDDVAGDFKEIKFGAATSIDTPEITLWCQQASDYADTYLASTYQVPVDETTSPKSFSILKMITTYLVADRVRHVLYTKTGTDSKDQDTKGVYSLSRNPKKDLKEYQAGTLKLPDAIALSSNIGFDTGCQEEPYFQRNKAQW